MSETYIATGIVKLIEDTQTFESGFQKREFVVTTEERYPQDIKFEVTKDKVELLDSLSVGDAVSVSFNLRGNEYNGKYYVNLQAWRIESEKGEVVATQEQATLDGSIEEDVDDIQF